MSENIENEIIVNDEPRPTGLQLYYPIVLDNVEYQYFKTWNTTRNDTVTTHETESGKQEDVVSRKGRRSIQGSVVCLQPLVAQLIALADKDDFEAKIYDVATDDYVTINARIAPNSMSYGLREKSADLTTVNGVYEVGFTLEEF